MLQPSHWPGKVRELENIIERSFILCNDYTITAQYLGIQSGVRKPNSYIHAGLSMDEYFVELVCKHQQHLNETELSARLRISRKNLWEQRQKLGISGN